ncbi:MAG: antitoxin family protein [Theionarchaea archaeon]|nr:antitoxin family protein [Theionarchaea archaeon]
MIKIRAIYKNNVLKPLEKLDLKEGEEVEIEVRRSMKDFHGKLEIEKEIADKIIEMEIWS